MGNPVEPNGYELGTACPACLGAATPKRILAVVTGIKACPPGTGDPNGFFVLPQGGNPCVYQKPFGFFTYSYVAARGDPIKSNFSIDIAIFNRWFDNTRDACAMAFTNNYLIGDCGFGVDGYDGTVQILYGPGI